MNKQELIQDGYRYIATQNNSKKTEIWAKFTGYEDTIQYRSYFPEDDNTFGGVNTISFVGSLELFALMRDKMREDFFKQDIKFDKETIWSADDNWNKIEFQSYLRFII